jgi:tetratricopeptide (TPR) repeat protein
VFVAALAAHLALTLQYRADPYFDTYVSDALSYHEWAQRIVADGVADEPVFHQAPLFPLLLAGLYGVAAEPFRPLAAALLQGLVGSCAIALLVPLGARLAGRLAAGLAAAALALAHGPIVYYDLKLLPVPLALLTQAGALLALVVARERRRPWPALACGAAWGVACLARAEMLLFVPVALIALVEPAPSTVSTVSTGTRARRSRLAACALLGAALTILPVTAHNAARGDLVLLAASAGENLFVGNQRGADGGHRPLHPQAGDLFSQRALARKLAQEATGRELRPSQISAYWRGRALGEVAEAPFEWVRLEGRKLARILHPGDPHDMYPFALERAHYLSLLHLLFVPSWWIWLLGAFGIGIWLRERRAATWPALALLAVHLAVLLAFFVSTRLRLPLLFLLCLPAGSALVGGWSRLRARERPLLPAAVAGVLLVVAVATPLAMRPSSRDVQRLGAVLSIAGRLDESLAVLEAGLRAPDAPGVLFDQAGWVRYQRGELEEARTLYLAALERGLPSNRETQLRTRLGWVEEKLGHRDAARRQHDLAVSSPDANAGTYYERGAFLLRQGEREAAIRDLRRSVSLDPRYPPPREALRALGAAPR